MKSHSPRYTWNALGCKPAKTISWCLLKLMVCVACAYMIRPRHDRHEIKDSWFLPRDAMLKRGFCRRPVSVRLSRSCIVSKQLKISSNFFLGLVLPSLCFFLTPSASVQFQSSFAVSISLINQFNSNLAAREPDSKWYAVEIIDKNSKRNKQCAYMYVGAGKDVLSWLGVLFISETVRGRSMVQWLLWNANRKS